MAITFANVTSGTGEGTSVDTASVTPASNKLQLLAIASRRGDSTDPTSPTVSGCGLTWVEIASIVFDTSGSSRRALFLFRALGASPSTGAITISHASTTNFTWILDQVTDNDASGTNGSGAIVQSATAKDESVTTSSFSVSYAGGDSNDSGNAVYGVMAEADGAHTITAGANLTELDEQNNGLNNMVMQTEYSLSTLTGASWSSSGSVQAGGIVVEIKVASSGTAHTITINDTLSLSDATTREVGKAVADTLSLAEASTKAVGKSIADTLNSVIFEQTANPDGVNSSSNVATYSNQAIGTAVSDRVVVVLVACELASTPIESCTLGGIQMNAGTAGNFGAVYTRAFWLNYPTGTTATVAVTFTTNSPSSTQNHISVYKVTGGSVLSYGGDGSTDMDATDPLTTGLTTIGTGGGMIAVAAGGIDTVAKTWSGLTEDLDVDAGALRYTTAYSTTAGTETRTCFNPENYLLQENFEDSGGTDVGEFDYAFQWGGSNAWAIDSTSKIEGTYSFRSSIVAEGAAALKKIFDSAYSEYFFRFDILIPNDFDFDAGSLFVILRQELDSDSSKVMSFQVDDDVSGLLLGFWSADGGGYRSTGLTLSKGTIHTIQIAVKRNATTGYLKVWLDNDVENSPDFSSTGINTGATALDSFMAGVIYANGSMTGYIYQDNYYISENFILGSTNNEDGAMSWLIFAGGISDDVTKAVGKSNADTLSLSDATTKAVGKPLADTLSMDDAVSKAMEKLIADTLSFSDEATSVITIAQAIDDTLSLTDGFSKAIGKNVLDTLTLADAVTKAVEKPIADTLSLSEASTKEVGKSVADTLSLSDEATSLISAFQAIDDTLSLADGFSKEVGKSNADTLSIGDEATKSVSKPMADTLAVSDAIQISIGKTKNISDTLALSDAITKSITKNISDTLAISDNLNSELVFIVSVADTITITDDVAKSVGKYISDSLGLTDNVSAVTTYLSPNKLKIVLRPNSLKLVIPTNAIKAVVPTNKLKLKL